MAVPFKNKVIEVLISIVCCCCWLEVQAQQSSFLNLSDMFSSNMVLQQGIPIPVWGKAKAGTLVTLQFNGKKKMVSVPANGKWLLKLPAQKAGGPFVMKIINEQDSVVLSNVMVGEVWVCSGQSNMEM